MRCPRRWRALAASRRLQPTLLFYAIVLVAVLRAGVLLWQTLDSSPLDVIDERRSEDAFPKDIFSRRHPLVYVYDWWSHCRSLQLCKDASLESDRAASCAANANLSSHDALMHSSVCFPNPLGPKLNSSSHVDLKLPWVESDTQMTSISALFQQRLWNSAWRTTDPDKASLFFIPSDPFLDKLYERRAHRYNYEKRRWISKIVMTSPWIQRKQGRDHFLVVAWVRPVMQSLTKLVNGDPNFARVTKLCLENYFVFRSVVDPEADKFGLTTNNYSEYKTLSVWGTVPYASFLHPTAAFSPHIHSNMVCPQKKDLLVAMSFSNTTVAEFSNKVRTQLLAACKGSPLLCSSVHIGHRWTGVPISAIVELYRRAQYCIVPPGDTLTSKRFFDAVSACCTPVILSPSELYKWSKLYKFAGFGSIIKEVSIAFPESFPLEHSVEYLANLSLESGNRQSPVVDSRLLYFAEEHPTIYDAIDQSVASLLARSAEA